MRLIKKIEPEFSDPRGTITRLLDEKGVVIKSIVLITSNAGSIRANHYHKKDSHYCYLASGKMAYSERAIDGGEITTVVVEAGDIIYTPPMMAHAMRFLEDSVFYTFATEHREQSEYEGDLVRIGLIE